MGYVGRPGVSPVTATLVALDWIRRKDRILDVGCGTGGEALLLAAWGHRDVTGIDTDPVAVRIARGRATRRRLQRRVRFERLDAGALPGPFPEPFDVVLHTLVANNLPKSEVAAHFAGIRAAMHPDGLLVVVERVGKKMENTRPDAFAPLRPLDRHFDLTAGVATHLPEGWAPGHARVVTWLGRPR